MDPLHWTRLRSASAALDMAFAVESPVIETMTSIPICSKRGFMSQTSPATLKSPKMLIFGFMILEGLGTFFAVGSSGGFVISFFKASQAALYPSDLLPLKPSDFTGITGMLCFWLAVLHTDSRSSPIIPTMHVEYTKTTGG